MRMGRGLSGGMGRGGRGGEGGRGRGFGRRMRGGEVRLGEGEGEAAEKLGGCRSGEGVRRGRATRGPAGEVSD